HDILIKWGEHLAVKPFSQLSLARKKNVLRFWLQSKGIDLPPENRLLELIAFTDDVKRESAGEFSWKHHDCEIVFRVFDDHLFFHQYPVLKPEFKDFQWNLSTQDYFDCGGYRYRALTALKEKISQVDVRFRKGGERCQPVGRAHSQTLKKLFQEFHIPPWER